MNTGSSTSVDNKNQGKSSSGFKDTFNNSSTVKKFLILFFNCQKVFNPACSMLCGNYDLISDRKFPISGFKYFYL